MFSDVIQLYHNDHDTMHQYGIYSDYDIFYCKVNAKLIFYEIIRTHQGPASYYRLSIYRGKVQHDIAHRAETSKEQLGHTSNSRKTPIARPNGRAMGVNRELRGENWPRDIRSVYTCINELGHHCFGYLPVVWSGNQSSMIHHSLLNTHIWINKIYSYTWVYKYYVLTLII